MLAILVFVLGLVAEVVYPWWALAPAGLLAGLLRGKSYRRSAGAGFVGVAAVWLVAALHSHWASDGILTAPTSGILKLPGPVSLFVVTVVVGGTVGALATASGFALRSCWHADPSGKP